MDPVNVSCIQWVPKIFCKRDMFYSHYDNENSNDNLSQNKIGGDVPANKYMDMPLDNEITNGGLLENTLVDPNNSKGDDEMDKDYLDKDDLSDSRLSVEDSDRILVVGCNYEDSSSLEIVLYNVDTCGLETHHEILLNGYPLAMKLIPRQNFGVLSCIGSYSPDITIWDIYDVDLLEPLAILSNNTDQIDEKNRGIISLDYQSVYLAAGSEDNSVYIWDLQTQQLYNQINHHNDKVQIVKWHNSDPNILISAAFDNKLIINDIRTTAKAGEIKLDCDVECAVWYNETDSLLVGFEDGNIECYDLRAVGNNKLWVINNSKGPCTSLAIKSNVLVASSLSGSIKVYTLESNNSNTCSEPNYIFKKKLGAGPIFGSSVSNDDEYTFAFGCEVIVIADLLSFDEVKEQIK